MQVHGAGQFELHSLTSTGSIADHVHALAFPKRMATLYNESNGLFSRRDMCWKIKELASANHCTKREFIACNCLYKHSLHTGRNAALPVS